MTEPGGSLLERTNYVRFKEADRPFRRDGRAAEGARLESVFRGNSNVGSNPTLSATYIIKDLHTENDFLGAIWGNRAWTMAWG